MSPSAKRSISHCHLSSFIHFAPCKLDKKYFVSEKFETPFLMSKTRKKVCEKERIAFATLLCKSKGEIITKVFL